jgi:predicted MPP superfamily phosphohydrolase
MLLLLLSAVAMLVGCHYFIHYSVLCAFNVSRPRIRLLLLIALTALAVSVPLALSLSRLYGNPVTRIFHTLSSFWLGLAIHLVLLLALCWLVHGLARCVGRRLAMRVPVAAAVTLALTASGYGLWQAQHPLITSLEVEIDDLPESWEGKTVVQLSDVHLGNVHGTGFLRRVVEMVNSLHPEAVFITGDLFDGSCSDFRGFEDLLDELRARRGVFFVTGNHEGYLGLEAPLAFLKQTKIRVLDDECVEMDGLQVVGIGFPWFSRAPSPSSPFDTAGCYTSQRPAILLYHTPTNVGESYGDRDTQQVRSYFAPDTTFTFAAERGIDLQLSGHTHGGQMFPFGLLVGALWNRFDHGLHRIGRFYLHVSSGTGTWGPPARTGSRGEVVAIKLERARGGGLNSTRRVE